MTILPAGSKTAKKVKTYELLTGHLGMYNHVFVKIRPRFFGIRNLWGIFGSYLGDVWMMSRWVFQLLVEACFFQCPNGMIILWGVKFTVKCYGSRLPRFHRQFKGWIPGLVN